MDPAASSDECARDSALGCSCSSMAAEYCTTLTGNNARFCSEADLAATALC